MTGVADEMNRVRIGVLDEATKEAVLTELAAASVPYDAVDFRTMQETVPAAQITDKLRPTEGGLQIKREDTSGFCTLGFVTSRSGTLGFVTASHCTPTQADIEPGDDTAWYQVTTFDTPKIGDETIDPETFTGGSCPGPEECRWSDAAFVDYDNDSDGDQGEIARTNGSGSTTINSTNPQFHVTAEATSYAVNDRLYKIGRTTGWSSGLVTGACDDFVSNGIKFLCQGSVEADVGLGDSGSPVFERPDASSDVTLHGVLWGLDDVDNPTQFRFSTIGLIYSELGASSTWDSCTSGC